MSLLDAPTPIEKDDHVVRARRTAALTRIASGLVGMALILLKPHMLPTPALGMAGFAIITLTAVVQMSEPGMLWLRIEESVSPAAGVLIVGLGSERVSVLTVLWLVAVASGVLARGGRVHWLGRNLVLCALALPLIRYGSVSAEYAALVVAALGLLLTSGRLTTELNQLLRQARLEAESAETLLLAGDIAARVADRDERADGSGSNRRAVRRRLRERREGAVTDGQSAPSPTAADAAALGQAEERPVVSAEERNALTLLLRGEGITMVAQPIVDVRRRTIHGYEALARFAGSGPGVSPLHWLALADQIGERAALERACLRQALSLFIERPAGVRLSLNVSAPVLLDPRTEEILKMRRGPGEHDLEGLVIEITEETLVNTEGELQEVIAPLTARGARLAVDDMGAGYSGLRQITSVRPDYLKLDRSLISGIDGDGERTALVEALAGYASKVGCLLVAEGVETQAELEVVRSLGVPLVQGFYYSRPAPPWAELSTPEDAPAPPAAAGAANFADLAGVDAETLAPAA